MGVRFPAVCLAIVLLAPILPGPSGSAATLTASSTLPILRLEQFTGNRLSLEPGSSADGVVAMVNANLVRLLPDGRPVPDLASWTVDGDGLGYIFTLRTEARFSNGRPVTARDAAFSLKRALAPQASGLGIYYLSLIHGADAYHAGRTKVLAGVRVLDGRRLQITLTRPAAYFPVQLSSTPADVVDRAILDGKPLNTYLTNRCAANQGAGPFTVLCRNGGSTPASFRRPAGGPGYTLVPNPYYYGGAPHIRVEVRVIVGQQGAAALLTNYRDYLAGRVDVDPSLPPAYVRQWKGRSPEYRQYASPLVDYLAPNAQTPPFDDLHCRLAVAYAIDRAVLAGSVRQGTARQTYAVVPKGMLGYYAGRDSPHYDLGRARSELAMCPDRTAPFALTYPSGAISANVPPAIVGMLRQAGMNAMVKAVPFTQWIDTVSRPLAETNTQLVWDSWFGNFPDPAQYCSALLRSGEQFSITGWKRPTFDSLVDRADRELNPTIRAGLYIKAQHLAIGEGAWITLDNQRSFGLIKSYVHGLVGSGALNTIVPKGGDWTKVWIGRR